MSSLSTDLPDRRLLLVHAHPDDETIGTGATMAKYVSQGAAVTLVTCTLGEEGEVLVDELAHLASERDDALAPHRIGELDAAMAELGVTDYLRLGGDFRFRDSGMVYDERGMATAGDNLRDDSFWRADLLVAANELVPVIRSRKPQVLTCYDEYGSYGHPDHVQAHRVAMYAAQLAAVVSYRPDLGEPWTVSRVLWQAMSESWMRDGLRALRAAGDTTSWGGIDAEGPMPPMVVPDEAISAKIDGTRWVDRKLAAMRAHATQIKFDGHFFALADQLGHQVWANEYYRLAGGMPFPDGQEWADDLFAGLQ